jgi:hypothetical protein
VNSLSRLRISALMIAPIVAAVEAVTAQEARSGQCLFNFRSLAGSPLVLSRLPSGQCSSLSQYVSR